MMFSVASEADAVDAPSRKPKQPFLRRGEGVNKRLNAYKLREEAESLRKQRSKDSVNRESSTGIQDQLLHSNSLRDTTSHQRGVWERSDPHWRTDPHDAVPWESGGLNTDFPSAPLASNPPNNMNLAGEKQEIYSSSTIPDAEDLELEEFRALEREILGNSGHSTLQHDSLQTMNDQQQHSHAVDGVQQHTSQRNQQHQQTAWQQQQFWPGSRTPQGEQQQQQQHSTSDKGDIESMRPPQAAEVVGTFQDDTEWVDTEFSFADLSAEAQQDQVRSGQYKKHQQQHLQRQMHDSDHLAGAEADDSDGHLAKQPYVRSVFRQQQRGRPMSSRSTTSAAARANSSRPRSQGPAAASSSSAAADSMLAASGTASQDDADQQFVSVPASALLRWQQLEEAQPSLQQEKAALKKLRHQLENASQQLQQQRAAWERDRAAQQIAFEAWKAEETKQLANKRRGLDQQQKALLKMPTKKEKSALEAIEAALEREKSEARAAAARHKLTVERLRCQVKQLQDRNGQLHEEVRWHETQQLNSTAYAVRDSKARKWPTCSSQTQTERVQRQQSNSTVLKMHHQADAWTAATQPQSPSDPLYAALFGDDDDDDDGAGAGAAAGAGVPSADREGTLQSTQTTSSAISVVQEGADLGSGPVAGSTRGAPHSHDRDKHSSRRGFSKGQQLEQQAQEDFCFAVQGPGGQQCLQDQHYSEIHAQPSSSSCGSHASSRKRQLLSGRRQGGPSAPATATSAHEAGTTSSRRFRPDGLPREVLKEYRHPDGKVELLCDDGTREVCYANGTLQVYKPDGATVVFFANDDVKRQWPNGRVDYYYAEVDVWQCTHPCGLDVYHYSGTGQVEGHFPDGRKEVIFTDGAARIVLGDKSEHDVDISMLSPAVQEPAPDREHM